MTHNCPAPHSGVLIRDIADPVPPEMFDVVARFDGGCLADRTAGEAGAHRDSEAATRSPSTRCTTS